MFPLEVKTTLGDTVCFLSGCVMSLQESKICYSDSRPLVLLCFCRSPVVSIYLTLHTVVLVFLHYICISLRGLLWACVGEAESRLYLSVGDGVISCANSDSCTVSRKQMVVKKIVVKFCNFRMKTS